MRKVTVLFVAVMMSCLAYGQDKKNGISFSVHCDKSDTLYKEIFVSETGSYTFYWGKMDSPSSVSFKADTISIWMVSNMLNPALVNLLAKDSALKNHNIPCAYTITVTKDGVAKNYEALPINEASRNNAGYDKIRRLAKVLQRLYDKYHLQK